MKLVHTIKRALLRNDDLYLYRKEVRNTNASEYMKRTPGFYKRMPSYFLSREMIQKRDPLTVLDIGCGTGQLIHILGEEFPDKYFFGFDFNSYFIEHAHDKYTRHNVSYNLRDALVPMAFPNDAKPDLILCIDFIEHLFKKQMDRFLDNLYKICHDNTSILIMTPNKHFADDGYHHVQFFNIRTLEKILKRRFSIERIGIYRDNPVIKRRHDILYVVMSQKEATKK